MIKRLLLPITLFLFALSCSAEQAAEPFIAGKHYDIIGKDVTRTAPRDKIEVIEFFWYGCGHCYTFEPLIQEWKKELADDVSFHPTPAVWRTSMEMHARAFYAAEALGKLDPMHGVIFQAMNVDRKPLASPREIEALFTANGISKKDFDNAFDSFGVGSQIRQAGSTARSAGLTGTPSMMVEGKYLISTQKAGSQANMLKVVDYLVEKERAARAQASEGQSDDGAAG